jgi:transposase-like protein
MAKKKPTYLSTAEKAEALNYAEQRGFDAAGKKYGVHPNTVRAWRRKLKPKRRGKGVRATTAKIAALEKQNKRLKTNNQKLRDKIKAIRAIVKR